MYKEYPTVFPLYIFCSCKIIATAALEKKLQFPLPQAKLQPGQRMGLGEQRTRQKVDLTS